MSGNKEGSDAMEVGVESAETGSSVTSDPISDLRQLLTWY
jgi:hypothetical protein